MKKKKNIILKLLSILIICVFSCFTFAGCMGGGGSGGGAGGGSGSGSSKPDKPGNENNGSTTKDEGWTIDSYDEFFYGAIGIYDIPNTSADDSAKVFHDDITSEFVDFKYLLDRQFIALSTVIYDSLNYVYGDGSFGGKLQDNKNQDYANFTSDLFVNEDDVFNVGEEKFLVGDNGIFHFRNTINGGYPIVCEEIMADKDEDGVDELDHYEFHYDLTTVVDVDAWAQIPNSPTFFVEKLQDMYLELLNSSNPDIDAVDVNNMYLTGFSEEYKELVTKYIKEEVIGDAYNANSMPSSINEVNYEDFQYFKNYEVIINRIIDNAFKLTLSAVNEQLEVSGNYCWSGIDWNTTLFPIIEKNEYKFFNRLKDVCDAEEEKTDFSDDDFNADDFESGYGEETGDIQTPPPVLIKTGSLRKLKEIILLPKITSSAKYSKFEFNTKTNKLEKKTKDFDESTFNIAQLKIALSTKTGVDDLAVNILTTAVSNNNSESLYKEALKFDDGSYSVDIGDGSDPIVGESNDSLTDEGYLKLNDTPSVDKNGNTADIFENENAAKEFKFSNLASEVEGLIEESFVDYSYTVETTSEKIYCSVMKVRNRLAICTEEDNTNKADFTLKKDQIKLDLTGDYLRFYFEYYTHSGAKITSIPELYLLEFTIP